MVLEPKPAILGEDDPREEDMEKRYINAEELSVYLGVSKTTVYYWVSQKKIPYIKRARLRFDLKDIDKWMAEKKVKELR